MMEDQDLFYQLALNFIPNIGAVNAKKLVSYLGGVDKVFSATKSELLRIPGIGDARYHQISNNNALELAEKELKRIQQLDLKVIFYLDDAYPTRLKSHDDCPLLLYSKGKINLNPERSIAVIGTRNPTNYGQLQCEKIVEDMKKYNVSLVSGLAYGVDTIAHRTAVKNDLANIAVLGNGLEKIYPSSNFHLSEKIKLNGGIISEFHLDVEPERENFPRRNRIIAALADVVIVIESARKGGSFITAEYANSYSKDVFALPGKITDPMSEGCNHLIKTHKAHLYTSIEDIAYINRWDDKPKTKQLSLLLDLAEDEKTIYDLIKSNGKIGFDTLVYESRIQLLDLSSVLINLEFKGLIKSLPGKNYILGA